jgi:hypothetical protein
VRIASTTDSSTGVQETTGSSSACIPEGVGC